MLHDHVRRLEAAIRRDFPVVEPGKDFIWTAKPPVQVIDCVLSLNRKYDSVVLPRVLAFVGRFPGIQTCAALRDLIDGYASPEAFAVDALNYRDPKRATTVSGVLDFAIRVQLGRPGRTEGDRLRDWAKSALPNDHKRVGVKGFGLAGFQYLRMLFGAETTKPDVHIIGYVSEVMGRRLTDVDALELLEAAAAKAGVPARWLDVAIWESRARIGGGKPSTCIER